MNSESEEIKDYASRFEDRPSAVIPGSDSSESRHNTLEKQNGYPEYNECESKLNGTSQEPKEARVKNVKEKESLADWGVVACVFLLNLIMAIDFTGFGVFYPYLVEDFETTAAAVGWCSSINGFFGAAVALFASYPIQSYGCRLPGVVGCLVSSIGISLTYLAPNLTTIYLTYGVIAGSGTGLVILSSSIIIHQRFTRNRNLASGIGWLGSSFGSIIGSILTHHLVQMYSWRGAFLIMGAIQAQRIPLCLFFRTPEKLISHSNHTPGTSKRRVSCQMILRYLKETFNFSILRQARFSVYIIAFFLHMFCMVGYWAHAVNRAIHVGLSRDQGVTAVTLIGVTSTVSRVSVSFIANLKMVNSSLVFSTGMYFIFLSIVAIFINPGYVGTMTSAALFGIYMGCTTTVLAIVAVDLMGVILLPKSLALLQFTGGLAMLVSPPLIGWVFDLTRDYNKAFAMIGCMAFVSGSLMVVLTVVTICQRKSVEKNIEFPSSPIQTTSEQHLRDKR